MCDYALTEFKFGFSQDNLSKFKHVLFHDLYHPCVIGINEYA